MHQTRKGRQWYFGLKAHIGVDRKEGTVHSVCTTAASVADKHMLSALLHGEETKVWGDGGYQGQTEAIKQAAPRAQDMTCRRTRFKQYVDEFEPHTPKQPQRVISKRNPARSSTLASLQTIDHALTQNLLIVASQHPAGGLIVDEHCKWIVFEEERRIFPLPGQITKMWSLTVDEVDPAR